MKILVCWELGADPDGLTAGHTFVDVAVLDETHLNQAAEQIIERHEREHRVVVIGKKLIWRSVTKLEG